VAVIKTSKDNFKIVPIEKLIPSPRNNNRHSIEQLERLAKIIEHRGFREPLTVSKRSGFVVCGHARLEAAKIIGMEELPVIYQDFESEAEEYGHLTADNEIARWAELDFHDIYNAIKEFDLSASEVDLLGIENMRIPEIEVDDPKEPSLSEQEKTSLKEAWVEWVDSIRESVAALSDYNLFCQSFNKPYLKIQFLRALHLGDKIKRSATMGYQPHRVECSGDGNNGSVLDLLDKISSGTVSVDRIRFAMQEKPSLERFVSVLGVPMAGHKAPLDFPVELATELYNEFAIGGKVLDPCHGWGGRYLGFALSSAVEYVGVDASNLTCRGLREMHNDLMPYHGKEATIINSPYEDTELEDSYFDFELTSPPYFDRETYIGGDQAHSRYKTYDEFIDGFYTALLSKTYSALDKGGHFALQVGNQKYDLDKQAIKIGKRVGFSVIEKRATKMSGVGDGAEDEIKEVIIIFRKQ